MKITAVQDATADGGTSFVTITTSTSHGYSAVKKTSIIYYCLLLDGYGRVLDQLAWVSRPTGWSTRARILRNSFPTLPNAAKESVSFIMMNTDNLLNCILLGHGGTVPSQDVRFPTGRTLPPIWSSSI
jgi:hypothetical protein